MKTSLNKSVFSQVRGWVTGVPSLLILGVLVLYPLLALLIQTVFPHIFDQTMSFSPSLKPFVQVLSDKLNAESLGNSVVIGLLAAILASVLGTITAFGTVKASKKTKIFLDLLVWITLFSPSYVIAEGWLIFMQDGGLAAQLFGLHNGWSAWFFSKFGLVLTMGFRYFPFVHLAMIQAVENLGVEFERAGRTLGAKPWTIFRRVTLPLLTPGLLAGASIAFAEGFGDFGFAAAITPQTHIPLLSYQIYASLNQAPVNYSAAAVLSLILILVMGGALGLQMWWLKRGTFVTVSSQSRIGSHMAPPKKLTWPTSLAVAIVLIGIVIPAGSTIIASLWKSWSHGMALSNWTFVNYLHALTSGGGLSSISRSLGYSLVAAILTMLIGLYMAYQMGFKKSPVMRILNVIVISTIAIPGVVLAAGFIFAWNAVWLIPMHLVLYGTSTCLAMAYIAGSLPYAIRLDMGAMSQLSPNLMTAAQSLGARQGRVMRQIVFPLISSTMVSTFFLTLTGIMFELPASSLLYPPGQPPLPVDIASKFNAFEWSQGAALTVIGMIFVLGLYGLGRFAVYKVTARRLAPKHPQQQSAPAERISGLSASAVRE